MKLVVTDTNVFIDVMDVNALEAFFALGLDMHTTGFVLNELASDQQALLLPYIGKGQLTLARFTDETVRQIEAMRTTVRIEFTDRSVVHLASELKAMVLSGDGNLWKECKARKLEVHGSLWVIAEIWKKGLLPPVTCIDKLDQLRKLNSRLPKAELDGLIARIRAGA